MQTKTDLIFCLLHEGNVCSYKLYISYDPETTINPFLQISSQW